MKSFTLSNLNNTTITMFWTYHQNNSGGHFHNDNQVSHYVIIEADTYEQANTRAQQVGIYFNGCRLGYDCNCCGDRWHEQGSWDKGTPTPMIYDEPAHKYHNMWTQDNEIYCRIYYLDGHLEECRTYKPAKHIPQIAR